MYPTSIIISSIIAVILYIIFVIFGVFKIRSLFINAFWILSVTIIAVLLAFNINYSQPDPEDRVMDNDAIETYIHFDIEESIPNIFSSVILLTTSGLSLVLMVLNIQARQRKLEGFAWLLICLLFALSTLDESLSPASIHGKILVLVTYVILGIVSVFSLMYVWWRKWKKPDDAYLLWVIGGLALISFGAIFIDHIKFMSLKPSNVILLEEVCELLGSLTVVIALLTLIYKSVSTCVWRIFQMLLMIVIIVIAGESFLLTLRASLVRQTVAYLIDDKQADGTVFGDDLLVLKDYNLPQSIMHPGDVYQGHLYFMLNRPSSETYSFSAHLLSYPDFASAAQQDEINVGDYKTTQYFAGQIIKQPISFTIPEVEEATAFALSVRLWSSDAEFLTNQTYDNWQNKTSGLPVSQTTHPVVGDDASSLLLKHIIVVPESDADPIDGQTIQFVNGMSVTISADDTTVAVGEPLSLHFQWATSQPITDDWIQILHLRNQATGAEVVFDGSAFDKRLPTSFWSAGLQAIDHITLPTDDIPVGKYDVITGMYNSEQQRLEIDGENDNNMVALSDFQIEITEP